MENRQLGRTGVSVSPLCLGAMMFGEWGNPDHEDSIRIIHRALDAGINFIDTADVYSRGESEEIVGKALAGGRRDDVVLATKVHGSMGDDPNQAGNSRRWIVREVENSLRRLQTDWIDLYQVHRPRTDTDIEETLSALSDLVRQGKGVLSYSPLTGGWLSGRWRKESGQQSSSRASRLPERFDLSQPDNQRKLDAVEALAQLAEEAGITLIQMAIAFVLNHPAITSAIIGPRTMEQLEGQLAAADVVLDEAGPDRNDEIV